MGILSPNILLSTRPGVLSPARMSMGGGLTLPRTNLLAYFRGGVDTIGLSVTDYDLVGPNWQDTFFIDPSTPKTFAGFAALYAAVSANFYFNGSNVVGSERIIVVYEVGTSENILEKAKRYARVNYYGVAYDTTNSNPDVTRVGLMDYHRSLPVQSGMYACLLNDDGTENYKLDPADWSKKLDGTASNRDGTDGQVMIKLPEYWFRHERVGDTQRWLLSDTPLSGFTRERPQYVSAYEAALHRPTSKLASVASLSADYRGGNNNAAWDAESRTLIGKPATVISRTNFRTYARNRGAGWEMDNYFVQRTLLRFVLVEFATRDSQKAVNAALVDGLRQGCLGGGCTNIQSPAWSAWNSFYPFINCGESDSLGSATGEVVYTMPAEYGVLDTYVNRYRGVELPFGHIWKNLDGVNMRIFADSEPTPVSEVFITDDTALWNDSGYTGFDKIGEVPRASDWLSDVIDGELMPLNNVGAGSTTYWCDYTFTSLLPASGESLRTVLLGGLATDGSIAGLGSSHSHFSPAFTSSYVGSRLCYIPA